MILKQIDTGEYPPGGRLPSEKELEKLYHVSRITAQKAMNLLAEDGRIVRLPGKGSFVIDNAAGISSASAEKQPLIGDVYKRQVCRAVGKFEACNSRIYVGIRDCQRRNLYDSCQLV